MALRLLGQDCAIQITDGGAQDGTPTYGSPVVVKAYARRISLDDTLTTEDMRGLGDARARLRGKFGETAAEIELLVPDSGPLAITLGNYVKVEFKALSSMVSYTTIVGLLIGDRRDMPDGPQLQVLRIACDADQ
jgi:hypothetical protein